MITMAFVFLSAVRNVKSGMGRDHKTISSHKWHVLDTGEIGETFILNVSG